MTDAAQLILLRHGESRWNADDRFAGWIDVPLSEVGREQARTVGRQLVEGGLRPDVVHCSQLQRAVETATLAIAASGSQAMPRRSWRLNERHYGNLQGHPRSHVRQQLGPEEFRRIRRSWDARPSASGLGLPAPHPYLELRSSRVGEGESLRDVSARLLPYWRQVIKPDLRPHAVVLVVAHGNSLRSLVKALDGLDDAAIVDVEVEVGKLAVYRFAV